MRWRPGGAMGALEHWIAGSLHRLRGPVRAMVASILRGPRARRPSSARRWCASGECGSLHRLPGAGAGDGRIYFTGIASAATFERPTMVRQWGMWIASSAPGGRCGRWSHLFYGDRERGDLRAPDDGAPVGNVDRFIGSQQAGAAMVPSMAWPCDGTRGPFERHCMVGCV